MSARTDLETLRKGLLKDFANADVTVKAQIAGQLRGVLKDLAALGDDKPGESKADAIRRKREARRSGAADKPPAARRSQPRRRTGGDRAS